MYETIVGRTKEDLEKFGIKACGYVGKHIVGTGEEAHLTTPVRIDLLRPHIVLISGKRGTGKCVEENTLITLDDGSAVPIKELENNFQSVASLGNNLKMTLANKSGFFKRKVKGIMKVKLRSGREIKLTEEHPLLTINGWKPIKELAIGSRVATPRKINVSGNNIMKECEIKILAYLIAEGHISNEFIIFNNKDEELVDDFRKALNEYDTSLTMKPHGEGFRIVKLKRKSIIRKIERDESGRFKKGTKVSQIKSSLRVWLEEIGLYNNLSKSKFIPQKILRLPQHQLTLFLNRLFSGDGSIYKAKHGKRSSWEISYSSESEELARQVQHLLLRYEILSKLRTKHTEVNGDMIESFEVVITGENVVKFINSIGFFGKKYEIQSKALKESLGIIRNPNVDTIPKEIWKIYRPKNWAEIGRRFGYAIPKGMRTSINCSPSREKILKIAQAINNESLYLLATSDIFWDEIVWIEKLEGDFTVCDIEVPEFHNFVANDIIAHNSYDAGIIAEEIALLPQEFRQSLAVVMIDTMGIFWSLKRRNEQQIDLLREWKLEPRGFDNVKVFVPFSQIEEFQRAGIPVDAGISILPYEFSAEEWRLAFNLSATEPAGIALEKNVNELLETREKFTIEDLITKIRDDKETSQDVKNALENMLRVANRWGVFGEQGINIDEIVQPGQISIVDVSHLRSTEAWSVRNFIVAILARKIYRERVIARKEEEIAKMEGTKVKRRFPMIWLIIDEAHNFLPSDSQTVSSEPLKVIAKQGREPGISLALITQMPNKLHQDFLSQCDLVFSHRLTSRDDLQALHAVYQTYMAEEIEKFINRLPRGWAGAALILDDNLEKVFTVQIRPRLSHHAGGTAVLI